MSYRFYLMYCNIINSVTENNITVHILYYLYESQKRTGRNNWNKYVLFIINNIYIGIIIL